MPIELLRAFLQQATATGSKSTVLTDLRWFIGIAFSGLLIGIRLKMPDWVLVLMSCILGTACLIYFAAYIYFGITAPDALRSEKFTLTKMALEHSVTGDTLSGFVDPAKQPKEIGEITVPSPKEGAQ